MFTLQNLQYSMQSLWTKAKDTFLSKETVVDGVLVGQEWELVEKVTANETIEMPDLNTFDEIYIEMYSSDGTITHQKSIRRDSILFNSSNTTYREILLDGIHDYQTYVTYDLVTHSIVASYYEGTEVDANATTVTTAVYIKGNQIANGNVGASKIVYNDVDTKLDAPNVQVAIEKLEAKIGNTQGAVDNIITNGEIDNIIGNLQ